MSVPLTPSADKNWITARWTCLEESMAWSLTVISLLLQSTTHCRYRVYTKFLLTYTTIYRGNRKVLPLGITALQPQSHFHLGTPSTRTVTFIRHWTSQHNRCWSVPLQENSQHYIISAIASNIKYQSNKFFSTNGHCNVQSSILTTHTDMRCLTTGICSEKCVVRRFRHRANVTESNSSF